MDKWLFWGLVESTTVLFVIAGYLISRSWALYRKSKAHTNESNDHSESDSNEAHSTKQHNPTIANYDAFIQYLDIHINTALDKLEELRSNPDKHLPARNKLKLWGTLLKTQKILLINAKSHDPLPVLQRFLSSVLDTVTNESHFNESLSNLRKKLVETHKHIQKVEKNTLSKMASIEKEKARQSVIQSDLLNTASLIEDIDTKEAELETLKHFISESNESIKKLSIELASSDDPSLQTLSKDLQAAEADSSAMDNGHQSIKELTSLSKRQKIVIDQLKILIDSSHKKQNSKRDVESQEIALKRLMRLSNESNSLIQQLENEVENETSDIRGIKNTLSEREKKIQILEENIRRTGSTVSESLHLNTLQKSKALDSYKSNLSKENEHNLSDEHVQKEAAEVQQLEHLLSESETCVTLLNHELSAAKEENNELTKKLAAKRKLDEEPSVGENFDELVSALNNDIIRLKKDISNAKINLLNTPAPYNYESIKEQYNGKKMEWERLEFAYTDLEKKYTKALAKKEAIDN